MTITAAENAAPIATETTFEHQDSGGDILTIAMHNCGECVQGIGKVTERDGAVSRLVFLDETSLRRLYDQLRTLFGEGR